MSDPPRAARRSRWRFAWVSGAILILLLVVAVAVYLSRREIGGALAKQYLRSQGVDSAIMVQQLSLHGFSGRLRLGPAGDPDATAERIDVDLTIGAPWSSRPFQVVARRVHLLRPMVKIAVTGGKVSFGGLDRLIGAPKPGVAPPPLPDISIDDGTAHVATPLGSLVIHGGGEIVGGRPVALDVRLDPALLSGAGWSGQFGAANVTLRSTGASITATANAPIARLSRPGVALTNGTLSLRFAGEVSNGTMLSVKGDLTAQARADTAAQGQTAARAVAADIDLPKIAFTSGGGQASLSGSGELTLKVKSLGGAGFGLGAGSADLKATTFQATLDQGRWTGQANLMAAFQAGAARIALAGTSARLSDLSVTAKGTAGLSSAGWTANLTAGASARGGLTDADKAVRSWLGASGGGYAPAVASALKDVRAAAPKLTLIVWETGGRLSLGASVSATSASGAVFRLEPIGPALGVLDRAWWTGAGALSLAGGGLPAISLRATRYIFASGALDADLAVQAAGDAAPVKAAKLDAAGHVHASSGGLTFDPSACASLSAERITVGETVVGDLSSRICGAPVGSLITQRGKAWSLHGRLEDTGAILEPYKVRADHIAGDFDLTGAAATLRLTQIDVADTGTPVRFRPVSASGEVGLDHDVATGKLAVTAPGHPIGTITLHHTLATGDGQALLDAPALRFMPGGLQPADLSPLAASLRSARGDVRFKGRFDWTPRSLTSSGEVSTAGLDLSSPLGAVSKIQADIRLTSLAPLVIPPGQTVTAQAVQAVVPLQSIKLVFGLDATQLGVQAGQFDMAGGQVDIEPVSFPLNGGPAARGVIVLTGIDLGKIVAASTLADKVRLDAVVDGRLPYTAGPDGFKLLKGSIVAVRPGRLAIKREVFVGAVQPNAIQDFAYQALANLAFDSLDATVESRPHGRLGVIFHIKGRHDPAVGQEAYVGVRQLADGSAFQQPIPLPKGTPIDLTLDTSLNFDQLLSDYQGAMALSRSGHAPGHSGAVQP